MRPKNMAFDVADEATDAIAAGLTGAGPWDTTDFTLSAPSDGVAHKFSITSSDNLSGITFTITGTDADGKSITDAITGPSNSTVESVVYLGTITGIAASSTAGANTFDIGWVDEVSSVIVPLDYKSTSGAAIAVDVTGTINFTVQETFDSVQSSATASQSVSWHAITALSGKTADTVGASTPGATAMRFIANSYSSGAEASVSFMQPSIKC